MSRSWVDFDIVLPTGASIELDVEDGALRAQIECHCDPVTLVELADTLRAAVVEVDAQRARLEVAQ